MHLLAQSSTLRDWHSQGRVSTAQLQQIVRNAAVICRQLEGESETEYLGRVESTVVRRIRLNEDMEESTRVCEEKESKIERMIAARLEKLRNYREGQQ